MSINWFNHQNKEHFALYGKAADLLWIDTAAQGREPWLFKRAELLNRRLARLSPRRGKKEALRIIEKLIDRDEGSMELLEALDEVMELEDLE